MRALDIRCKHCGETLRQLVAISLLKDDEVDVDICHSHPKAGRHEFSANSTKELAA